MLARVEYFRACFEFDERKRAVAGGEDGLDGAGRAASPPARFTVDASGWVPGGGVARATVERVLRFAYTGDRRACVPALPGDDAARVGGEGAREAAEDAAHSTMELLVAAEHVGLGLLARLCGARLARALSGGRALGAESVAALHDFAERFDLPRLASQAEELLQGGGAAGCEESKVGCA